MKVLCFFVVVFGLLTTVSQTATTGTKLAFTDCGSTGGSIENLMLYPEIPRTGDTISFRSTLVATKSLEKGTFFASVTRQIFGFAVPVFANERDLCKLIVDGNCPIKAGTRVDMNYDIHVPIITPPGKFHSTVVYRDGSGNTYICFKTGFRIYPPFGSVENT